MRVFYGLLSASLGFMFPDAVDPVAYHYPVALRWLHEGTMWITTATNWRASLPGNVEILDLLILSTGHERLLGTVQWPGLVILTLAVMLLGRRLGKSATAVWPVVTTTLMIPIVANQAMSGYVDLFGAALLFGSLALLLEYCDQLKKYEKAGPALIVVAGMACGLAVGAKPVFWLFATVLALNTLFLLLRRGGKLDQRGWGQFALFLAGAAVPSIFWFARAAAGTGNPLYPFAVDLGFLTLPGVRPSDITEPDFYLEFVRHRAEWFVYPWTEWKSHPGFLFQNYTMTSGLGGAFATFVMPGLIFAAWLARRERPDLRVWLFNFVLLGFSWWFFLNKVSRFGLPLFILAVIVAVPLFEVLELRATRMYRFLYVSVFTITACILAFTPLYSIAQTVRTGDWSRATYLGYPKVIDALPPGSKVLSLCDQGLNFALSGSGLTNRVIPSWEVPTLLTADFLRARQVDYIVEKFIRGKNEIVIEKAPPVEGLESYFRSTVPDGENLAEWRIWKTSRSRNGAN